MDASAYTYAVYDGSDMDLLCWLVLHSLFSTVSLPDHPPPAVPGGRATPGWTLIDCGLVSLV